VVNVGQHNKSITPAPSKSSIRVLARLFTKEITLSTLLEIKAQSLKTISTPLGITMNPWTLGLP